MCSLRSDFDMLSQISSRQIEGRLHLKEIAEGGTTTAKLCLTTVLLWMKDAANTVCPSSLRFSLALPSTFTYEDKSYVSHSSVS